MTNTHIQRRRFRGGGSSTGNGDIRQSGAIGSASSALELIDCLGGSGQDGGAGGLERFSACRSAPQFSQNRLPAEFCHAQLGQVINRLPRG
jgi:hypothetical protein